MRISDVFVMGGGFQYPGGEGYIYDTSCYGSDNYCHRSYDSPDKYNDPRSYRTGLAEIIGTRRYGGAGLKALFINHG